MMDLAKGFSQLLSVGTEASDPPVQVVEVCVSSVHVPFLIEHTHIHLFKHQ